MLLDVGLDCNPTFMKRAGGPFTAVKWTGAATRGISLCQRDVGAQDTRDDPEEDGGMEKEHLGAAARDVLALAEQVEVHERREDVDNGGAERGADERDDEPDVLAEQRHKGGPAEEQQRGAEPGGGLGGHGGRQDVEEGVAQAGEEERVRADNGDGGGDAA